MKRILLAVLMIFMFTGLVHAEPQAQGHWYTQNHIIAGFAGTNPDEQADLNDQHGEQEVAADKAATRDGYISPCPGADWYPKLKYNGGDNTYYVWGRHDYSPSCGYDEKVKYPVLPNRLYDPYPVTLQPTRRITKFTDEVKDSDLSLDVEAYRGFLRASLKIVMNGQKQTGYTVSDSVGDAHDVAKLMMKERDKVGRIYRGFTQSEENSQGVGTINLEGQEVLYLRDQRAFDKSAAGALVALSLRERNIVNLSELPRLAYEYATKVMKTEWQ